MSQKNGSYDLNSMKIVLLVKYIDLHQCLMDVNLIYKLKSRSVLRHLKMPKLTSVQHENVELENTIPSEMSLYPTSN